MLSLGDTPWDPQALWVTAALTWRAFNDACGPPTVRLNSTFTLGSYSYALYPDSRLYHFSPELSNSITSFPSAFAFPAPMYFMHCG